MRKSCVLAEVPNFGRVYDCGGCGGIHVTVGPVSITFTPEAYLQFVAMMHASAANFESWLGEQRGDSEPDESTAADSFRDFGAES
jgi:hypothetical protein